MSPWFTWVHDSVIESAAVRERSSLAVRLSKGFSWNLVATISNHGATFAGNVIVARLLGPRIFGEYAMVQATLVPLAMVVYWAASFTTAKHVAEYRSADPQRAGRVVALCGFACLLTSLFVGCLLLAVASPLASSALDAPQLAPSLLVGAVFVICTSLNGYEAGILTGLEQYTALTWTAIGSGLLTVAGITLGATLLGLTGAVLALSVTALIRLAIHQYCVTGLLRKAGIPVNFSGACRELPVLGRFALPLALTLTFTLVIAWLANLILIARPDGFEQFALYSAGLNIKSLAFFVPAVFNNVLLSVLNHLKGAGDWERYHKLLRINLLITFLLTAFVAVAIQSIDNRVFAVFGRDFGGQASVLLPFLLASVCEATANALNQSVQAHSKVWFSFLGCTVPRDVVFLWSTWQFAPLYGAWGMAWSFFAASCYFVVSSAVVAWWIGRVHARAPQALAEPQGA
ncbi:MAG: oligosaccharide flippase family protein [Gemmataceae bacterium]|nr:oligosaccharide flippase family protein [Gemmataceae bacterium]